MSQTDRDRTDDRMQSDQSGGGGEDTPQDVPPGQAPPPDDDAQPGGDGQRDPIGQVRLRVYGQDLWGREVEHHVEVQCPVPYKAEATGHDCRFPLSCDTVAVLIGTNDNLLKLHRAAAAIESIFQHAYRATLSMDDKEEPQADRGQACKDLREASRDLLKLFKRRPDQGEFADDWEARADSLKQYLHHYAESTEAEEASFVGECAHCARWADLAAAEQIAAAVEVFFFSAEDYCHQLLAACLRERHGAPEIRLLNSVAGSMPHIVEKTLPSVTRHT